MPNIIQQAKKKAHRSLSRTWLKFLGKCYLSIQRLDKVLHDLFALQGRVNEKNIDELSSRVRLLERKLLITSRAIRYVSSFEIRFH